MSLKTKIKNDLWHLNYIVPFAKKYLNDEDGNLSKLRKIISVAAGKRVVKGRGDRSVASDTLALFSSVSIDIDESLPYVYFIDEGRTLAVPGNVLSNFTVDSEVLVNETFDEVIARAVGDGADEFGKSSQLLAEALSVLRNRTVRAIEKSNYEPIRKRTLEKYFREMFCRPAQTFDEGLQRVLFLNQVLWQTRHRLNGLGRLDKILGPLYEADVSGGRIDARGARSLVAGFLKILHGHYAFKSDALMGDIGQIIILGGTEPDGSYFRNELTDIFLEEQAKSSQPDPKVFLRCSASMPRDLMSKAVQALRSATGSPLFSNDDRVIPALMSSGISREDSCSYCVSACWEPLIPGKSLGQNNMLVFDAGASIKETLSDISENASYAELKDSFARSVSDRFSKFLEGLDEFRWAEDPLVSLFYPACVEDREDVARRGGAESSYGVTVVGVANAVDSLSNAERLLTKGVPAGNLSRAVLSDFSGEDELLEDLENHRLFGSDDERAADLTNWVTSLLNEVADGYRNQFGGGVKFGLSSPAYIMLGKHAPADLSGRRDGEPYTVHISNSSSSYTELVNFAAELDYSGHRFNGNVVDFFVAPSLLEDHADQFVTFMMSALRVGFFQMQMNVMDSSTLIDAKAHPENYPGLIVRVWGFSAYFNDLPESYKDYLIERAKESERR